MGTVFSPERSEHIRTLFRELVSLAPEERALRLAQLRANDSSVGGEVEALLTAHERADEVLQSLDRQLPGRLSSPAEEQDDPLLGRRVSHYQILEKLGGGGMGVVYKARDTKLDRMVALKFLPPHLSLDEEAKRRLIREAKAASALDHPNLCTIHEIGETDAGQLFLAMAYYPGKTLKKKIARGPLPLSEALEYAAQIAEGLAAAHEAGIIHRDLKPANVLVTARGQAKLVDFGIAKVQGEALTRTGVTLGTAAYMSPEQARGEAVDHRTDLWSLGVVLYEMLTGVRPFRGEHEEAVLYGIRHDEPPPLEALRPEVPPELARLVRRCLAKDPAERYASAEALRADLRSVSAIGSESGTRLEAEREEGSLRALIAELRRRSVFRVGAVYAAVAFVLLQVADLIFPALLLPEWSFRLLVVLVLLGFPLALVLAWAFELTPEGVRRTQPGKRRRGAGGPAALPHPARSWRLLGGVAAVLLVVGVPVTLLWWRQASAPPAAATLAGSETSARQSSLAVLPLRNYSGDPAQEFFADGMTEELITTLGKIEGLRVINHQSVLQFKGSQQPVPEIARLLEVEYVVTGSVLQDGERVRFIANLIDAASNTPLWGERFEQERRDILVLQRHVALAIAREVEITLTPQDRARLAEAPQVDPEAFDLYVKATQSRYDAIFTGDYHKPLDYFARALTRDSAYAPAYAGMAWVYAFVDDESRARAFVERALALDPTLADAHVTLGLIRQFYDWDWAGAEAAFREAIRLNPGYAEAYHELSMLLIRLRRFDEALRAAQQALYLAPMSLRFENGVGEVYVFSGRYDDALQVAERLFALDSTFAGVDYLRGIAYTQQGRYEEAAEAWQKCIPSGCGDGGRGMLGYIYAVTGRRAEARSIADTLTTRSREARGSYGAVNAAVAIARIHIGLGEQEQALDWLERGAETGSFMYDLAVDPTLRSLNAEPRFQALLRKMGLDG